MEVLGAFDRVPKSIGISWIIRVSFVTMKQLGGVLGSFRIEAGYQKDQAILRSLELLIPSPILQGGTRDWRLS